MARAGWRLALVSAAAVLVGCTSGDPAAEPPAPAAGPTSPETASFGESWPGGGRCPEVIADLAALSPERRQRLSPEASPLALAVIDRGAVLPGSVAAAQVVRDLPVSITDRLSGDAPCLLLLDRTATVPAGPRRSVAHELVRSTYRRGTRRTANAEHEALKRAMREVEQEREPEIIATGDPSADLVGLVAGTVLSGVDLFRRRGEAEELRGALAGTPASFEEPVWEPYSYEVTTVEASRSGRLRAALVDRAQGRSWSVDLVLHEARSFRVASGRHVKDRAVLEGHDGTVATPADLDVWEEGDLRPSTNELVERLAGVVSREPAEARDAAAIAATWGRLSQALPQPLVGPTADEPERRRPARTAANGSRSCHRGGSSVQQVVAADGTRRYQLAEGTEGCTPASPSWDDDVTEEP